MQTKSHIDEESRKRIDKRGEADGKRGRPTKVTIKHILESSIRDRGIVSVYLDDDWDSFSAGRIVQASDEVFVLRSYNRFGEIDGLECRLISNLSKIEFGGVYERNLEYLISAVEEICQNQSHDHILYPNDVTSMDSILNWAKLSNIYVVITCIDEGNSVGGTIANVADGYCDVNLIDNYGEKDGIAIISTETISAIDIGTKQCIRNMRLYKKQNNMSLT